MDSYANTRGLSLVPDAGRKYRSLFSLNPMASVVECLRSYLSGDELHKWRVLLSSRRAITLAVFLPADSINKVLKGTSRHCLMRGKKVRFIENRLVPVNVMWPEDGKSGSWRCEVMLDGAQQ